ncbi:cyclic nucleotide-gated ion channel 1-like [Malus sylvestris]|uniref:cyclic nucleotide-gated ion channel 1-like n=1 Tax=Malus sylvestris TaxID=3752 RepID=UPI0021ACD065|nr:cyclic nucleotide-gated ion channel 1-like [Malus sylvestris]
MNPREEEIIEIPSSPNRNPAATSGQSSADIDYGKYRPSNSSSEFFARNDVFLLMLGLAVSVDPLFFYIPILNKDLKCIRLDKKLTPVVLSLLLFTYIFYVLDIIFQLRAIHEAVRREDQAARREDGIAKGWSRSYVLAKKIWGSCLLIDILGVAPIPLVFIRSFAKIMRGSRSIRMFLNFLLVLQYMTRVLRFDDFRKKLEKDITKTSPKKCVKGVFRFWIRSAFICFKFILASHVGTGYQVFV